MIVAAFAQDNAQLLLLGLVVGSLIVGVLAALITRHPHDQIGRGWLDASDHSPSGDPEAARSERAAEIRQMLEARTPRRVSQVESSVEIETELILLNALAAWQSADRHSPSRAESPNPGRSQSVGEANGPGARADHRSYDLVSPPAIGSTPGRATGRQSRRRHCPLYRLVCAGKRAR